MWLCVACTQVEGYDDNGTVAWLGRLPGDRKDRAGVSLNSACGKNDGTVTYKGVTYELFTCADRCGVVVLSTKCAVVSATRSHDNNCFHATCSKCVSTTGSGGEQLLTFASGVAGCSDRRNER